MKILNGKWVDNNNDPIDNFNFKQFQELSTKVYSIYGSRISYNRIEVINSLSSLDQNQERGLKNILTDAKTLKLLVK